MISTEKEFCYKEKLKYLGQTVLLQGGGGGGLIHKSSKGRNLHKPSDMSKEGNKTLMRKIETIVSQHIQETNKTFKRTKLNQFKNWRRKITILIRKTDKHLNNLDSSSAYTESLLFSPLLYCPTDHGLGLS